MERLEPPVIRMAAILVKTSLDLDGGVLGRNRIGHSSSDIDGCASGRSESAAEDWRVQLDRCASDGVSRERWGTTRAPRAKLYRVRRPFESPIKVPDAKFQARDGHGKMSNCTMLSAQ